VHGPAPAWNSPRRLDRAADDAGNPDAHRSQVAPAFLLTAVEGFTPAEAAQILDTDYEEVEP